MSIAPTWPIAAGALVAGLIIGAGADHLWMAPQVAKAEKRYNDLDRAVGEERRQREVQRAADERKAREIEQRWATRAGQIEQEKENAIAQVRTDADALIDRLRKQAASKPTRAGGVPAPGTACPAAAGGELPERGGEDFVRLAERADTIRAGLAACYRWADEVMATPQAGTSAPAQ